MKTADHLKLSLETRHSVILTLGNTLPYEVVRTVEVPRHFFSTQVL